MNDRMSRINEQVRREIGLILQQDMVDSRLRFVSVLRVAVSKDLRNARVFYSVLGEEYEVDEAREALQEQAKTIRKILASRIKFRFVPELNFSYDRSLADSEKIDEALKEIYGEVPDYNPEQSRQDSGDYPRSEE